MYTNTSITLYLKSRNYVSVYIDKCFLTHQKIANSSKQGLAYDESAFMLFQSDLSLSFQEGKDYAIEGKSAIVVDTTSDKTLSDSLKSLIDSNAVTIMKADWKNYGSDSMRHWEISCK